MIIYGKEREGLDNFSPHYSIPIQERHKKEAFVWTSSKSFKDIPYIIKAIAIIIPKIKPVIRFIYFKPWNLIALYFYTCLPVSR